jgi:hypothetical protein
MTEAEWLATFDLDEMIEYLDFRSLTRKKRLFGVAACYRVRHLLEDECGRVALVTYEKELDSQSIVRNDPAVRSAEMEMMAKLMRAQGTDTPPPPMLVLEAVNALQSGNCRRAAYLSWLAWSHTQNDPDTAAKIGTRVYAELLRDIFGNPFRPVAFSGSWRTDTAVSLARTMYEARDFSAMPILADALQDAGCDSEDVLTHCRGDGPHVRGCWVCDLVLGKE